MICESDLLAVAVVIGGVTRILAVVGLLVLTIGCLIQEQSVTVCSRHYYEAIKVLFNH